MGNREALLDGAKRCLYEKGYARTTARDLVRASGVSLAAIGYHFGTKEALLNEALIQASQQWGDELERVLATNEVDETSMPMQRFESTWNRMIELFETHRPLWAASFEMISQSEHSDEIRGFFSTSQEQARQGLVSLLHSALPEESRRPVGLFYQALLTGVMAQWLTDPANAPSGRDLTDALKAIIGDTVLSHD
ncbi:TetR/AcrR family transcriptional regulator [Streptomyces sp. NBC_01754]|uniref:TetR/AcrR family transcriptional regulator n=1 Tax=Streptomyces sp. NBC_01754 TaxID=2975930 RepID=UPI002DDBEC36|nr:TetR/AcrR family transcriptional regulator [Streptomyces sp. NBC_01754]WSC94338.1 TetR/AcrR family transcriptional regulator [Streptomyces sp. NBC_01754]